MSENGGSAFPIERKIDSNGFEIQPYEYGMTLRDYFAGKALQGFIARGETSYGKRLSDDGTSSQPITISERCYELADAMLEERKI